MSDKKNGNGTAEMPVKIEVKNVTHRFTPEETIQLGKELSDHWRKHNRIEAEASAVSKQYKAQLGEVESRIGVLSNQIQDGFEIREERCQVRYYPNDRKKRYWRENENPELVPFALEENMVEEDFQQELILAESVFDRQDVIELYPPTDTDKGVIVVGLMGKHWYAAVRARIGKNQIHERLDSEQPISAKQRFDAIQKAAKRFENWVIETMGKEIWNGFIDLTAKALEPEKEKVE